MTHGTLSEETFEREYGTLPVEGRVVFDWGADYGTTARWFLKRGAARVISSEADARLLARLREYAATEPRVEVLPGIEDPVALELALARCDVAKVDVEGAERLLLDVSRDAIIAIPHWVMETHSPEIDDRLRRLFETVGFRWTVIRTFKNPLVRVVGCER